MELWAGNVCYTIRKSDAKSQNRLYIPTPQPSKSPVSTPSKLLPKLTNLRHRNPRPRPPRIPLLPPSLPTPTPLRHPPTPPLPLTPHNQLRIRRLIALLHRIGTAAAALIALVPAPWPVALVGFNFGEGGPLRVGAFVVGAAAGGLGWGFALVAVGEVMGMGFGGWTACIVSMGVVVEVVRLRGAVGSVAAG